MQVGNAAIEGATIALLSRAKRAELEALVKTRRALPARDASRLLRLLRRRLPVQAGIEFAPARCDDRARSTHSPDVDVQPASTSRLLGYPARLRARRPRAELARLGADVVRAHGRPWVYAREAEQLTIGRRSIDVDGVPFTSERLRQTLVQAEAHGVVLVAVSAGPDSRRGAAAAGTTRSRTSTSSSKSSAPRSSSIW